MASGRQLSAFSQFSKFLLAGKRSRKEVPSGTSAGSKVVLVLHKKRERAGCARSTPSFGKQGELNVTGEVGLLVLVPRPRRIRGAPERIPPGKMDDAEQLASLLLVLLVCVKLFKEAKGVLEPLPRWPQGYDAANQIKQGRPQRTATQRVAVSYGSKGGARTAAAAASNPKTQRANP